MLNDYDNIMYATNDPALEEFFIWGHNLTLEILKQEIEALNERNEIETLKGLFIDLRNIVLANSSSTISPDAFSGSSDEFNMVPS